MAEGFSREELEATGLTDFRVFLCHVWAFLNLPKPTKVQLDIAYYLQHGPRRKIIMAFRGVGKSWITVAFVLWTLLLDPQKKIMVVSAGEELSGNFTKFCLQLIHGMPILNHLAPRQGQRNSALSFDVGPATPSRDPSVKSVGITGQLTGSRADLIVGDDVETPKNSYTNLLRERLRELVKEFDAVLKPEGKVIYLGTPQIEGSLYNILYKDRGYDVRIWPAEIPAEPSKYGSKLAPRILAMIEGGAPVGTPTDPMRFGSADLLERRASYGLAGYALQFMLDTTPSDIDRYPLKLRNLIIHDCDGEITPVKLVWGGSDQLSIKDLEAGGIEGDRYHRPAWISPEVSKYTETIMTVDPSGQGKDETAYSVVRYAHGMLYLVDNGGFVDGYGEATLSQLAAKCARHRVNYVVDEPNFGGGMFRNLLAPHLARIGHTGKEGERPVGFDPEWKGWSKGQKEERIINVLAPVLESHRLVVDPSVVRSDLRQQHDKADYSLVQQLTRMARVKGALKHDDRLDSLAMAATYFTEKMNRDTNKALAQHQQSLLDKELRTYMANALGRPQRRHRNYMGF